MESYSYDEHRPVKEIEGLDRLKGMKSQQVHQSPYIYLSPISKVVAEVFYMNNFEVNLIFSKFLDMWSKNPTVPYIQLSSFVTKYKLYTFGIVQKFFAGGRIYHNQFFQFICIMVLFDYNHIISLIISACKIHSNVLINHMQIVDFMETIDKDNTVNLDEFFQANEIMNIPDSKSSAYSIKAFTQFIRNNIAFQEKFVELQYALVKDLFPAKYQQRIYKRYQFYTLCRKGCILSKSSSISSKVHNQSSGNSKHPSIVRSPSALNHNNNNNHSNNNSVNGNINSAANNNNNLPSIDSIPKESCIEKISRLLLNEPKPYHFDYCISTATNPDFNNSDNYLDTLVLLIKQAYGYGYRSCRSSKFIANRQESDNGITHNSLRTSHASHTNINSHITANTCNSNPQSPILTSAGGIANRMSRKHTIEKASALQHGLIKKMSNRESFSPSSARELKVNSGASARRQTNITSK